MAWTSSAESDRSEWKGRGGQARDLTGIPTGIENDHPIGSKEIDSHSTGTCGDEIEARSAVRRLIERSNVRRALFQRCLA